MYLERGKNVAEKGMIKGPIKLVDITRETIGGRVKTPGREKEKTVRRGPRHNRK